MTSQFLRQFSAQQFSQLCCGAAHSYVELAEQRIDGADVVEAHLVDQLLEDERIVGKEVDAPFPIIEADRAGDDLFDFARIAAAYQSMFVHLAGTFFNGKR